MVNLWTEFSPWIVFLGKYNHLLDCRRMCWSLWRTIHSCIFVYYSSCAIIVITNWGPLSLVSDFNSFPYRNSNGKVISRQKKLCYVETVKLINDYGSRPQASKIFKLTPLLKVYINFYRAQCFHHFMHLSQNGLHHMRKESSCQC